MGWGRQGAAGGGRGRQGEGKGEGDATLERFICLLIELHRCYDIVCPYSSASSSSSSPMIIGSGKLATPATQERGEKVGRGKGGGSREGRPSNFPLIALVIAD